MILYFAGVSLFLGAFTAFFFVFPPPPGAPFAASRVIFAGAWVLLFSLGLYLARFWRNKYGMAAAITAIIIVFAVIYPSLHLAQISKASKRVISKVIPERDHRSKREVPYTFFSPRRFKNKAIPHLMMFAALGFFTRLAISRRSPGPPGHAAGEGRRLAAVDRRRALWQAAAGLLLFAAGSEVFQLISTSRSPGLYDFTFNILGLVAGVTAARIGRKYRGTKEH